MEPPRHAATKAASEHKILPHLEGQAVLKTSTPVRQLPPEIRPSRVKKPILTLPVTTSSVRQTGAAIMYRATTAPRLPATASRVVLKAPNGPPPPIRGQAAVPAATGHIVPLPPITGALHQVPAAAEAPIVHPAGVPTALPVPVPHHPPTARPAGVPLQVREAIAAEVLREAVAEAPQGAVAVAVPHRVEAEDANLRTT